MRKIIAYIIIACILSSALPVAAQSETIFDEVGKQYTAIGYGMLGSGSSKTLSVLFGTQSDALATDTGIFIAELENNAVNTKTVLTEKYIKGSATLADGTTKFFDAPILGVRTNSSKSLICVEILYTNLPEDMPTTGAEYAATQDVYTIYSPERTSVFPEGTVFILGSTISNHPGTWAHDVYDGEVYYYMNQSAQTAGKGPYTLLKSNVSGSYYVWGLCRKLNDDQSRTAAIDVDGVTAEFSQRVTDEEFGYRWEKDAKNQVVLISKGEEFLVRLNAEKSGMYGRIAAIALVPATAQIPSDSVFNNAVIYDDTYNLSAEELLRLQNESFEVVEPSEEVNISVNGTEFNVTAKTGIIEGFQVAKEDRKGNKIEAPTVFDALITYGIPASDFENGQLIKKRVQKNGENVIRCDLSILSENDEITIAEIDNTNFEPVNYDTVRMAEGASPDSRALKMCLDENSVKKSEIAFSLGSDGTLVTDESGLSGCYLNGYVITKSETKGMTSSGEEYIIPKGQKVYFPNVKIEACVNPDGAMSGFIPDRTAISAKKFDDINGYGDSVLTNQNGYIANPFCFVYGGADYDYTNLYITNKNTSDKITVEKYGGSYYIFSDTLLCVCLIKVTYEDETKERLRETEIVSGFSTANTPVKVDVNDNQKVFVWNSNLPYVNEGSITFEETNMIPLMEPIENFIDEENNHSIEYPLYLKEIFPAEDSATIQNDVNRMVFYKGKTNNGTDLVQYEIYTKNHQGEWILIKDRTEESGFLMQYADYAEYLSGGEDGVEIRTRNKIGDYVLENITTDFYKFGISSWLIPYDYQKISDTKAELYFKSELVDFKATYSFDDLVDDIKVTIDTTFNRNGSYSFTFFNGDGVDASEFDTVTAPFLYIKHAVPEDASVLAEPYMFTPMNTLYFTQGGVKAEGNEVTIGVAVDPSCVKQGFTQMENSNYGTIFRTVDGKVRSHVVAPLMGCPSSEFKEGEQYSFSCRLINRTEDWYSTYKHVAIDMYNCTDLRNNYYGSLNNTVYNVTDLMMDEFYSGWDNDYMGWYYMEQKNLVSQANVMSAFQRYLLTENNEIATERVVPTIAYLLSRGGNQYSVADGATAPLSSLDGNIERNAAVYGGLYEMSGGRMPYLLDYALTGQTVDSVFNAGAFYKYTADETYKSKVIEMADAYMETYPNSSENREIRTVDGFVNSDYYGMVFTLVAAYEITQEEKYLDAAEECARLLTAVVWTTDYQNDYATNNYYIDPIKSVEFPTHFDKFDYFDYWWHGEEKWRPGNTVGEAKSALQLTKEGALLAQEETVPGWVPGKAGLGTEHVFTPANNNVITMSTWLGTMVRLSEYTGDEWFRTQARNAIIGRYQNYPGYYIDRYTTVYSKADYPYKGPDLTGIYFHHIPVFLSMVEDYMINEAWARSNRNIDFPKVYQSGYAFFSSNQYGHASGKFYEQEDMWLWLDKGIVNANNKNIDYIAARKDGVLGIAFMNEDDAPLTTTVTLGEKIGTVNGSATFYDANGVPTDVLVSNGKFDVTVPAKGITSFIMTGIDSVKKPAYAKDYVYSNQVYNTMSAHKNGYGYVIQVNDNEYYAYVYIKDQAVTTPSATLTYTVDGISNSITDTNLNHEWLIKVDNPARAFEYTIRATDKNGITTNYGGGLLEPLSKTLNDGNILYNGVDVTLSSSPYYFDELPPVQNLLEFTPFKVSLSGHGRSGNNFRLVCADDSQLEQITSGDLSKLVGLKLNGTFTSSKTGARVMFEQYISGIDFTTDGKTVLVVPQPANIKGSYFPETSSGTFDLQISPQ